jgi:hypothetical protein
VGTMEVRAGCQRVRSFISENREHLYTCLVDWFRDRSPDPTLIGAFIWSSGSFHVDSACTSRAGRRKWPENF